MPAYNKMQIIPNTIPLTKAAIFHIFEFLEAFDAPSKSPTAINFDTFDE